MLLHLLCSHHHGYFHITSIHKMLSYSLDKFKVGRFSSWKCKPGIYIKVFEDWPFDIVGWGLGIYWKRKLCQKMLKEIIVLLNIEKKGNCQPLKIHCCNLFRVNKFWLIVLIKKYVFWDVAEKVATKSRPPPPPTHTQIQMVHPLSPWKVNKAGFNERLLLPWQHISQNNNKHKYIGNMWHINTAYKWGKNICYKIYNM